MRTVVLASNRSSFGDHGHELHDEDVGDVVLLVGLEHVVLEVGQERADAGVHDLVLDVGVHGEQLDDLVDELALAGGRRRRLFWNSRKRPRISWWSCLSWTMASWDICASLGVAGSVRQSAARRTRVSEPGCVTTGVCLCVSRACWSYVERRLAESAVRQHPFGHQAELDVLVLRESAGEGEGPASSSAQRSMAMPTACPMTCRGSLCRASWSLGDLQRA